MQARQTRYAVRPDGASIAYQVFGEGPTDLRPRQHRARAAGAGTMRVMAELGRRSRRRPESRRQ